MSATDWIPGDKPDIPTGKRRAFWVTLLQRSTGRKRVEAMWYCNAHVMGLSDHADGPPSCAVPHRPDEDGYCEEYEWTCWTQGDCEYCEAEWIWGDPGWEIIAHAPAPEPYQPTD